MLFNYVNNSTQRRWVYFQFRSTTPCWKILKRPRIFTETCLKKVMWWKI